MDGWIGRDRWMNGWMARYGWMDEWLVGSVEIDQ